ncbi:hypothetical protein BHE90_017328 [Fusarium euwallaceae]|uniref:Uncharacterized protein n=1 Tax=Fusarium euwallaceae TaxID=1147111 RepID=A0A430KY21_9HYPO|nr:hypothetical protein BHE90_017328 [Fusarium euwallaceae]
MQPATALHRHQSSLEGIIDFSTRPPLTPAQHVSASRRFDQLVNHFNIPDGSSKGYDRVKLVRLTYEYARSKESKDNFLRAFFESADLPIDGDEDIDLADEGRQAKLRDSLFNFAEYLFENFFLPCVYHENSTTVTRISFGSPKSARWRRAKLSWNTRTRVSSSGRLSVP